MITVLAELKSTQEIVAGLREFAGAAPDLYRRKLPAAARRVSREARSRLAAAAPDPPAPLYPHFPYPLRWKTERQRRAFFASDGFGRGIPTQRTGALLEGFAVRGSVNAAGGVFELVNDADYARFVVGDDQQPFHEDIGWYGPEDEVFAGIADYAVEEVEMLWARLVDPWLARFGG